MTQFALFATLLVVVVAAFILPPLWFGLRAPNARADRKTANLAIFRDQLAELEREKAEGSLADGDFEQARQELQRRLLEEVEPAADESVAASHAPSRKTAIAILLLLPILGMTGYSLLGNPRALDPEETAAKPQMTQVRARLRANPADPKGWLMRSRPYKSMGRYAEAVEAFGKAEAVVNEEPDLLAAYAETIAMAEGKGLKGKPTQLVEKALKLDAKHAHSLFLAGAAAMERGDSKKGIAYWEAQLPQVEPGSDIEQMLRSGIDKMKAGQ